MTENKASIAVTKAIIQNALDDWPRIVEMAKFQAKIYKVNYDAAIEAGFTQEQALVVCKK